jgi:hypothetical protein
MLAKDLHMTRAELIGRISTREFSEWIAYYNLEAHDREQAQKRASRRSNARRMSSAANQGGAA